MLIEKFNCLTTVSMTFEQLEDVIVERNLVDYTVNAIKAIAKNTGKATEERTFEGYALEALVGKQLEDAGVKFTHNTSLDEYWYDIAFPDGTYVDVKKHTSWTKQTAWLSIHKSVLERGGQLRHLRDYGNLKNLHILFINVQYLGANLEICKIDPSWVVKADVFFDQLFISQNPEMRFFDHRNAVKNVDFIRFNF